MPVQLYRMKAGKKVYTSYLLKEGMKTFRTATQNIDTLKQYIDNAFSKDAHEPFNVFCTLAEYSDLKRKTKEAFVRQTVMAFDVDKINIERMNEYPEVIARALLLDLDKCFVVCSGGGIHFVFEPEDFVFPNVSYFEKYMPHYMGWMNEINTALREAGLPGECDLDFFKPGVMVRWPGTLNIKPMETAPDNFKTKRQVVLLHGKLLSQEWDITAVKPVHIEKKEEGLKVGQYGSPDVEEIQKECLFLKHAKEKAGELTEPQWFRMLNLLGHMDESGTLAHEYSAEDKKRYTREETDEKLSAAKDFCGPFTCDSISKTWDGCKACPHYRKIRSPITLKSPNHVATRNCGFTTVSLKGKIERHQEDLRRYFEEQHPYVMLQNVGAIYLFNGKHYVQSSKDFVTQFAQANFSPVCEKNSEREEFWNIVKNYNQREPTFFETPEGYINLRNGVLKVETMELLPHAKDFGFLYCLPYDFTPGAECPTWDLMMKNLTRGRQHMIDAVEEYLGYIISGMEYHYNKMLVLAGDGNNGKTTVLNCMQKVVGEKNYASIAVQDFKKTFTPAELFGKLANFSEEASKEAFRESPFIKALTGNSEIQVERKFENPFKFKNRAKIVLTYNEIPYISDKSEGMARRLLVLPFDVNLNEEKDKLIPDIYSKIEAELPGILNRALRGYQRLRAQNGFTDVPEAREEVRNIFKQSDGVFEMWEDMIEKTGNPEHVLSIDDMWNIYTTKVDPREGGGSASRVERRGFGKKIGNFIKKHKGIEVKKKKISGDVINVVTGVRWLDADSMPDY
jgi:P4 family phage/plasmid primase-like protien